MKEPNKINVLIACEESQRVCIAFRERGFNAFSCDIVQCSGEHPEWHIWGDCLPLLNGDCDFYTGDDKYHVIEKWDLIIAHPPCTYMCSGSACRMYPTKGVIDKARFAKAMEAKQFFLNIFNANCERICIENPTPLKCVKLPDYTQIIQPYQFGEPYSKRTCLWLKGLPHLQPTKILNAYYPYVSCGTSRNKGNPDKAGVSRKGGASKVRSKTFEGIALAMAKQWGDYLLKEGD